MTATTIINKIAADFSDARLYNRVYIPRFYDRARFQHFYGSAGSGKSVFVAQREIVESFEPKRANRNTLIVRQVANTHKDSTYAELKSNIYRWGLQDQFDMILSPLRITNRLTGVSFIFRGLDDVEKLKSVVDVDRVWIEEATELKRPSDLDQINTRLRGYPEAVVTLSYNPVDENHWIKTDLHDAKPENHSYLHTTYKDNEHLMRIDPGYAQVLESYKDTSPGHYRVYTLGLWGVITEGLVFDTFTTEAFPEADGKLDVHFYGLDFGYSEPTALIAGHIADALPKPKYMQKELLYKHGLDAPELIEQMDALKIDKRTQMICDNARPEMIASLRKAGYNARACEKGANSIVDGIDAMRKYQIIVDPGSKQLQIEYRNYRKKEVLGKYIDQPENNQVDHGIDAARYGLQAVRRGGGIQMEQVDW